MARLSKLLAAGALLLCLSVDPAKASFGFQAEQAGATLTTEELTEQVLAFSLSDDVSCEEVSAETALEGKEAGEITIVPSYENCTIDEGSGEATGHVLMNSCRYVVAVSNETEGEYAGHGPLEVDCAEAEDKIEIKATIVGTAFSCIELPEQSPGGSVDYINQGSGATRAFTIQSTVEGIEYTRKGVCGEKSAENAVYAGDLEAVGETGGASHVGLWVGDPDPHETPPPEGFFYMEAEETTIKASESSAQVFQQPGGQSQCEQLSVEELTPGEATVSKLSVQPTYAECQTSVGESFITLKYNFTGCMYDFTGDESLDLVCPEDKYIDVTATALNLKCYRLEPQELEGVTYTNIGSGSTRELRVDIGVAGLSYIEESMCGEGQTTTDTTMMGEVTLMGEDGEGEHLGIWFE